MDIITPLLTAPLSTDELVAAADSNGYVTANIEVEVATIINHDLEGFLDALSLAVTGTEVLTDITYTPFAVKGESIIFTVSGNISLVLEDD